jgi:8-oxo-dGTP pyrophosphatase MutT (NUDIX family)
MPFISYRIPISVKGIVFDNGKVWLRKNERDEWELPGGKLDEGEQPEETVVRELREELGFETKIINLVSAFVRKIPGSIDEANGVLVLVYQCKLLKKTGEFEIQGEGGTAEFQLFSSDEIVSLSMPDFFRQAIDMCF